MYRLLFTLVLRHLDPETAHALARATLRGLRATRGGRALLRRLAGTPDPVLETRALGLTFPSPVGVAAGVDKDASWFEDLAALGFGFVEVGTLTALAQEGNPRPRVARFPRERALLNRMGFPNPGAAAAVAQLAAPARGTIVGVNLGKSKLAPLEGAAEDYRTSTRLLAPHADYLVINVSSPNTPGLRTMQAIEPLRELIGAVRAELRAGGHDPPLLVKLAPDLADEQLDAIAALAVELGLAGIVAVNTTVDRGVLAAPPPAGQPFEGGGVSGAPLRRRALQVLRRLHAVTQGRLVLVSVGGVESAEDVWERIRAGATLVQAYTGLVYGGPGWPRRLNRELAGRVRAAGAASIGELVGP
jgi:dihydroorotate dehydrogenase